MTQQRKQNKPRGGKREGAGRPRSLDGSHRRAIVLDDESLAVAVEYSRVHGCGLSAAIRALLRLAAAQASR